MRYRDPIPNSRMSLKVGDIVEMDAVGFSRYVKSVRQAVKIVQHLAEAMTQDSTGSVDLSSLFVEGRLKAVVSGGYDDNGETVVNVVLPSTRKIISVPEHCLDQTGQTMEESKWIKLRVMAR